MAFFWDNCEFRLHKSKLQSWLLFLWPFLWILPLLVELIKIKMLKVLLEEDLVVFILEHRIIAEGVSLARRQSSQIFNFYPGLGLLLQNLFGIELSPVFLLFFSRHRYNTLGHQIIHGVVF